MGEGSMVLDPQVVRRAAEWKQGAPCPWNGCPAICVHAENTHVLLCDACDVLWSIEAAEKWLRERGGEVTDGK